MKQSTITALFLAIGLLRFLASTSNAQVVINATNAIDSVVPAANGMSGNASFERSLSSDTAASYIAGLRVGSNTATVCAGVLIAPLYVLTTHCYSAYKFQFGEWRVNSLEVALGISTTAGINGEIILASKVYVHPDYNMDTRENEFFIVKLSESSKLTPVTLGDGSGIIYGVSSGAMKFWANRAYLQTTAMTFTNPTVCAGKQSITDTHLCASAVLKTDMCNLEPGDLLLQSKSSGDELVGLLSFNNACGSTNTPVVFSAVSKARAWIKSIAGV